jgi:hypothetical protein
MPHNRSQMPASYQMFVIANGWDRRAGPLRQNPDSHDSFPVTGVAFFIRGGCRIVMRRADIAPDFALEPQVI